MCANCRGLRQKSGQVERSRRFHEPRRRGRAGILHPGHTSDRPMADTRDALVRLLVDSRSPLPRPPDDPDAAAAAVVVVCSAVRTPVCKARRGGLKDRTPDDLLAAVLTEVVQRANHLHPAFVGDVAVGNVLQPGAGAAVARMAMFRAGYPEAVPCYAVNRQCASGLQAVAAVAAGIVSGTYDVGVAAGVESMTHNSMVGAAATPVANWDAVKACPAAAACMLPMGVTSENVAARYGVSRADQDAFAAASHAKAARARAAGLFRAETVAVGADEVQWCHFLVSYEIRALP